ncbi:MAG: cold-shock protein [Bacteroidales bacterium]
MGRSHESFNKKEVRNKKEKKRKEKEKKRLERKENENKSGLDDMIAYVDENGQITSTPPDPGKKEKIKAEDIEISIPKKGEDDDLDPIREGTVSFFNHEKGFGFIVDSETKEKVFVHVRRLNEPIEEGNKVNFEVEPGPKGPVAVNVNVVR